VKVIAGCAESKGKIVELEAMAAALEATGDYRLLRRLVPRSVITPPDGEATQMGLFVDVETTGLDPECCEIIELAMIPFTYSEDGRIFEIHDPFHGLREPREPISAEITKITGIDDSMVAGNSIGVDAVGQFIENVDLVVAHNASFDRQFLERFCPAFEHKPWGCSNSQVDWKAEGFEGTRLGYLAAGVGYFYDQHRALNDCYAAIELLAIRLPKCGEIAFKSLLDRARQPSWRIWASYAPFDLKDVLRGRGYRWNASGHGPKRAWFIDVSDEQKEAELAFLRSEIYRRDAELPAERIDAYNRFSARI